MKNNQQFNRCDCDEESDSWLVTYADLFTLLFAFFVLIAASGSIDQGKFDQIRESTSASLDKSDKNEVVNQIKQKRKSKEKLKEEMMQIIEQKQLKDMASFEDNKKGLKITFPSKILFQSGSATLQPEFKNVMKEIIAILNRPELEDLRITVEGHTDDVPVHNEKYPSNWELSASRAASVVNYMTTHGFAKQSVKVAGYADSKPITKISDSMTQDELAKARAVNRRIELQILYYKDQF